MSPVELNAVVPRLAEGRGALAVSGGGGRVERPFAEVAKDVDAAASRLARLGAGPGRRVGILAPNGYEWVVADLACLRLGAISVPFDRRQPWPLERLAEEYELTALVTDVADLPGAVPPASLATSPPAAALPAPHRFRPEEPYTVKLSSGTSAAPKAVEARALHFDHMGRHLQEMFRLGPEDVFLVLAPLSTYLQRFLVHLSILAGARVVLGRVEQAVAVLQAERPTVVIGVPQLLESLRAIHRRRLEREPSASLAELWGGRLRCLWTGSAPIDRATLDGYERAGVPVYEGYGMTETGMIAKNYPGARRHGSVGRIFPGQQLELGPNGEIVVRGELHANTRYWKGGVEGVFLEGNRVATGDLGRVDADGFLYIEGRAADSIVLQSGHKVLPGPVEEALRGTGAIADCAVFGQGRPYLVAVVAPADPDAGEAAVRAAIARVNETLPAPQRVLGHVLAPRFTSGNGLLTPSGKLDRKAVLARFGGALSALYGGGAAGA